MEDYDHDSMVTLIKAAKDLSMTVITQVNAVRTCARVRAWARGGSGCCGMGVCVTT